MYQRQPTADNSGRRTVGVIAMRRLSVIVAIGLIVAVLVSSCGSSPKPVTISGAIADAGAITDYRTVTGDKILIRRVAVGKKGTITFLITLYQSASAPGKWTITSATRTYTGLHGSGAQVVDNYTSTPATFVLAGTVSQ